MKQPNIEDYKLTDGRYSQKYLMDLEQYIMYLELCCNDYKHTIDVLNYSIECMKDDIADLKQTLNGYIGENKITKLPKPILNDAEKEYLGNIIKPFRNRIIWIGKSVYIPGEYIEIYLRHYDDGCSSYSIILPYFKKGTMYKGMELDKEYTLEELGL